MNRLSLLLQRYADNVITSEELEELFALVAQLPDDAVASALTQADENRTIVPIERSAQQWQDNWSGIRRSIPGFQPGIHRVHFMRRWGWAAAAILVLFSAGAYLFFKPTAQPTVVQMQTVPVEKDIAPGKQGAILTLADGQQIVLDSVDNGIIAEQSGVSILLDDGRLAYSAGKKKDDAVMWNTMATPRGRQFQVVLPDGTKVWLNAASSLRYPTAFKGSTRTVEVKGEAYFEVAANKAMPFQVTINDNSFIEVLGTHFNVNAYADEPAIKTTLLEGRVRFGRGGQSVILAPGQQAVAKENVIINNNVDVEQVVAWKNGVFNFTNAPLDEFMRQLARWYDLEVVYEGAVPDKVFKGKLGRNLALSQILEVLSIYNIQYRLDGRTLTILAN